MEVKLTKSKLFLLGLISMLLFCVFSGMLTDICNAEDEIYRISLVEKKYECVKTVGSGKQTWVYFDISITLSNTGDVESDDITVEIEDEDGKYYRNYTFQPRESKTFIFDDHPLLEKTEHRINISFYPTNKYIVLNDYNHGEDILIILPKENANNSTPGFESIFPIIAIAVLVFLKRYKKIVA